MLFAIGRSHVSDRLSHPLASKYIIREEMILRGGGEVILIKDYKGTFIFFFFYNNVHG